MNICIVTRGFSLSWGGAERVSVYLTRKLIENGHSVHVLTGMAQSSVEGATIQHISTPNIISLQRIFSFQRQVEHVLAGRQFDLVYGLCQCHPVDIYRVGGGLKRHWMRVRYPNALVRALKYATSLVHSGILGIEERIYRDPRPHFVTNSQLIKREIMEYYGIDQKRITVIYNGVDHTIFNTGVRAGRDGMRAKLGLGSNDTVLLFVGNDFERKGLATVIRALPLTRHGNVRLVVVGRGRVRKYKTLARRLGLGQDTVIFAGPSENVETFYGMADLFVLPSIYDPFANVCLEAMACGLPVITTHSNGASELIDRGMNGEVLSGWQNADELAACIDRLSSHDLRDTLREYSRKTAASFTWDRHLAETLALFAAIGKNPSQFRDISR